MRIIGPEDLVMGVDNIEACRTFLVDYGLKEIALDDGGFLYEALDGTAITLRDRADPVLPPALPTNNSLRLTVWGCEDQAAVDKIAAELATDREVSAQGDGSISVVDDVGFRIAFRATKRRPINANVEQINCPGAPPGRKVNETASSDDRTALPRTLSHIVFFTPDMPKMERFYVDRLGFVVTDRFNNVGPFLRPQANDDHHCLFLLQTPPFMQGLEHFAFHMAGPNEMMLAGSRMLAKGYESFWGPGRHVFGSNWFWYLNSPMGMRAEYDADMDKHDDTWVPRVADSSADAGQVFLFENVEKWNPGGPPPGAARGGAPAGASAPAHA